MTETLSRPKEASLKEIIGPERDLLKIPDSYFERFIPDLSKLPLLQTFKWKIRRPRIEVSRSPDFDAVKCRVMSGRHYLISFTLSVRGDQRQTLYVMNYDSPLRGYGLATELYAKLSVFAKEMGFSAIVGGNSERNINFFINKLRRKRLNTLPSEERDAFLGFEVKEPESFTIELLE
jgi:hypothetical protein